MDMKHRSIKYEPSINYRYEGQRHDARTLTHNLPHTTNMKDRSMKYDPSLISRTVSVDVKHHVYL